MARYKKHYDEQAELNEAFHVFVKKHELAYRGPNTAFHQIQSPIKKIRKTCVEYCTTACMVSHKHTHTSMHEHNTSHSYTLW